MHNTSLGPIPLYLKNLLGHIVGGHHEPNRLDILQSRAPYKKHSQGIRVLEGLEWLKTWDGFD